LGSGFWVLGSGFWVLGSGFWVLGSGFWVLGSGEVEADLKICPLNKKIHIPNLDKLKPKVFFILLPK